MFYKIITLGLVFLGEALFVAAELYSAKYLEKDPGNFTCIFLLGFLLISLSGAMLLLGYMFGYLHLKNIWIITAVSLGALIIIEPLLAALLFQQAPSLGASLGLIFGILGITITLLVP